MSLCWSAASSRKSNCRCSYRRRLLGLFTMLTQVYHLSNESNCRRWESFYLLSAVALFPLLRGAFLWAVFRAALLHSPICRHSKKKEGPCLDKVKNTSRQLKVKQATFVAELMQTKLVIFSPTECESMFAVANKKLTTSSSRNRITSQWKVWPTDGENGWESVDVSSGQRHTWPCAFSLSSVPKG